MLAFLLTTEGYSREDGNVYYSPLMVVHNADKSHEEAVTKVITTALEPYGVKHSPNHGQFVFDAGYDGPGEDYDAVWDEVVDALNAAGFHADKPVVQYIIADTREQHS